MTLDEAVAEAGRTFCCTDGPSSSLGPTGEPYVIVVTGGIKEEGEPHPVLCSTPEQAVKLWLDAVTEYGQRPINESTTHTHGYVPIGGKRWMPLYWRARPEMNEIDYAECGVPKYLNPVQRRYVVYSRLLISDKPVIEQAA